LSLSNKGLHASSDYIEDALMSRITTIGCRRCGGGFGGKVFLSNVSEGAKIADSMNPELIILEGSGASVPDVGTFKTICVIGANQNWEEITGYMGIYRILISDIVILTNCEKPIAAPKEIDELENNIRIINPSAGIYRSIFRPFPLGSIKNKKVVVAMTAKSIIKDRIKKYIEKSYHCSVVGFTFNLSNRILLKKELQSFTDYDAILTELKAASVDIVTDFALKSGKEIIYMNNIPKIMNGSKVFEQEFLQLYDSIKNRAEI
jgi:cyclic 2,3-diphosphoglycerate synthetase